MGFYVCREKEAVSFLSLFYLFIYLFHIKCKIPWLFLLFMPNYAVEKDLKSICGGLFSHLKPLARMGAYNCIPKTFKKVLRPILYGAGRPLATSSLPWPLRGQKSSLHSLRNLWSRLVACLLFFPMIYHKRHFRVFLTQKKGQRVQNLRVIMGMPQSVQPFEQLYLSAISFDYD